MQQSWNRVQYSHHHIYGNVWRRYQMSAWYRATNHPDVRRGFRTSAEVRQDFLQTLSDVMSMGAQSSGGAMVSFPSFLDFYCSLTAFTSDGDFR